MSASVVVRLDGPPQGKGRGRRAGNGKHVYTPARTRAYETSLAWRARAAMGARTPLAGPLAVMATAIMPVPPSWSGRKRASALAGEILPTVKPDWENIGKTLDAFNGIVWVDDAQVCDGRVVKLYGEPPGFEIEVTEMRPGAPAA